MIFFYLQKNKQEGYCSCSYKNSKNRFEFEKWLENVKHVYVNYYFIEVPSRCISKIYPNVLWSIHSDQEWKLPWPGEEENK